MLFFLYKADALSWFYYNLDSLWDTSRVVYLCTNAYIFIYGLLIILLIKYIIFSFAVIFSITVLQFLSCCKLSYHWLLVNVAIFTNKNNERSFSTLCLSVRLSSWQASISIRRVGVGLYSEKNAGTQVYSEICKIGKHIGKFSQDHCSHSYIAI